MKIINNKTKEMIDIGTFGYTSYDEFLHIHIEEYNWITHQNTCKICKKFNDSIFATNSHWELIDDNYTDCYKFEYNENWGKDYIDNHIEVKNMNVSDLKIKISKKNFTTKEDEKSYIQDLLKESNREQNLGDLLDDN